MFEYSKSSLTASDEKHALNNPNKNIRWGADGRERLLAGWREVAEAAGSTYGPRGRNVIIDREKKSSAKSGEDEPDDPIQDERDRLPKVTKDGKMRVLDSECHFIIHCSVIT
jgi:hypothetical protein